MSEVELLLVRHGNTFGPGDAVTWVGAREDLTLVASGEAQARELGEALKSAVAAGQPAPDRVLAGPLQRTRRAAELALESAGLDLPIEIEQRLIEVDYGPWGGLTTEQLVERFGAEVVEGWEQRCAWPPQWVTAEAELRSRVAGLVEELRQDGANQRVLILSSNGVLRYFLQAVEGAFEAALAERTFKLKTGRGGRLIPGGAVLAWNAKPHALLGLDAPA